MKKSVVLIELIVSIILFSVISIYSLNIILKLYEKNSSTHTKTLNTIKLEATRLYLIKNKNLHLLRLDADVLYYSNNILLSEVSKYNLNIVNKIAIFDICIKEDKICQRWKIKL